MPLSRNSIASLEADLTALKRRLAEFAPLKAEHDELEAFLAKHRNGSATHGVRPMPVPYSRTVFKRSPQHNSKTSKALREVAAILSGLPTKATTFVDLRRRLSNELQESLTVEAFRTILIRHGMRAGIAYEHAGSVNLKAQNPGGNPGPE